jgi:hypothetical protein
VGKYSQAPFYGTLTGVVLRMVFGRQWVARIASILMTACFAAVNARNRRSVAGIMQLIKGIEIDFANKPDVFVYSQIILLSNLAEISSFCAAVALNVGLGDQKRYKLG